MLCLFEKPDGAVSGPGVTPASPDVSGNLPHPSQQEIPEKSQPCLEQQQAEKKLGLFELGKGKQRKINFQPKYVPTSGPFPWIKGGIQIFAH